MTFSERIKSIIKKKCDGNKAGFARKIGVHVSTIDKWGDDQLPNGKYLRRIQKEFNVNLNWLVNDQGEPYVAHEREEGGEIKESRAPYNNAYDQAGYLLANILSSGDQIMIQAILANLKAFNQAIQDRQKDKDRIEKLEQICDGLKERISTLEDKHKTEDPHGHDHESKRSTAT